MRDLPSWARSNLARRPEVNTLARVAAMSPRTFARHFYSQFGATPAKWVQSLRERPRANTLKLPPYL